MDQKALIMKKRGYSEQRSPTLNTVIMVEETLSKAGELLTIGKLKNTTIEIINPKTQKITVIFG